MSNLTEKMLQAAAGSAAGGGFTAIEDVFSTYLYTSTNVDLTITNGINIPEFGGMTWFKPRTDANLDNHIILDTERADTGSGYPYLITNSTAAQATLETPFYAGSGAEWLSDGFKLGQTRYANGPVQGAGSGGGVNMASWTFRKAPRFFDVVTYTGDGSSSRSIAHNLGVDPGCVISSRPAALPTGLSTIALLAFPVSYLLITVEQAVVRGILYQLATLTLPLEMIHGSTPMVNPMSHISSPTIPSARLVMARMG
jgi:hypothetical protein